MDDFFENVMASANALEKAFNTITAAADRSVAEVAAAAAAAAAPSQPGTGANNADAEIGGHGCFIHDGDADDDGGGTTEEGSDAEGIPDAGSISIVSGVFLSDMGFHARPLPKENQPKQRQQQQLVRHALQGGHSYRNADWC